MSKITKTNKKVDTTRRSLLKGAAYSTVLSMAGISSQAFAGVFGAEKCATHLSSEHNSCGLRIIQETVADKEHVTIINDSNKLVMLNAKQPITVTSKANSMQVNISENSDDAMNGKIIISEGERISFDLLNADNNMLAMMSDHSIFNRAVPIQLA